MKKTGKRLLALALAAALAVGLASYAPGLASNEAAAPVEQSFPDVPADAWYAEAVDAMKDSGIIMGCEDGLFHPEKLVTQGEFYTMILRAGTFPGANISGGWKVGDHWAGGVLLTADLNSFGINGLKFEGHTDENGKYRYEIVKGDPDNNVTRTEAVIQLVELWLQNAKGKEKIATMSDVRRKYLTTDSMPQTTIPDAAELESFLASPPMGRWVLPIRSYRDCDERDCSRIQ